MLGKSFQFSIGSTVSFQLRAGFTASYYSKPQQDDQLESQHEELAKPSKRAIVSRRVKETPFYEVVGPYSDGSATSPHKNAPATVALPAHASEEAALAPAVIPPEEHQIVQSYRKEVEVHQKFSDGETVYVHSYNQSGQRIFAMVETSTVDLVI